MLSKTRFSIVFLLIMAMIIFAVIGDGLTNAKASSGIGVKAIFSGQVKDGNGLNVQGATVHLSCNDGTLVTTLSGDAGWYTIITDDNPAVWCSLWATKDNLSSGYYGMSKDGWNRQDLDLIWYFNFIYEVNDAD